jgi:hypothetical protein
MDTEPAWLPSIQQQLKDAANDTERLIRMVHNLAYYITNSTFFLQQKLEQYQDENVRMWQEQKPPQPATQESTQLYTLAFLVILIVFVLLRR